MARVEETASSDGSRESRRTGVPTSEAAKVQRDLGAGGGSTVVTPEYDANGKFAGTHTVTTRR
ncbi:hypothetical protein GCM10023195_66250 [Actinoallomurus liliacearum]|uniref:Uncharacterized protein n=1 Tax=Actinoallomurus liliacearum TaxID=1080073 RepID=A0ABP8TUF6_9ACTN